MFIMMGKKKLQFYAHKIFLSGYMVNEDSEVHDKNLKNCTRFVIPHTRR